MPRSAEEWRSACVYSGRPTYLTHRLPLIIWRALDLERVRETAKKRPDGRVLVRISHRLSDLTGTEQGTQNCFERNLAGGRARHLAGAESGERSEPPKLETRYWGIRMEWWEWTSGALVSVVYVKKVKTKSDVGD